MTPPVTGPLAPMGADEPPGPAVDILDMETSRQRTHHRSPGSLRAVLVALALLTAACSRGGSESTATPASTSETSATTTTTDSATSPETSENSPAVAAAVELDLSNVKAGVEPAGDAVAGEIDTPDGRVRSYHLYVPSGLGDEPVPLLVALHGGLGSGPQFEQDSGFDRLAEANGFVVVYPDGIPIVEGRDNRVWNGGGCCGPAVENRQDVDDVAFISSVIDEVEAAYPVDGSRVYVTGHSNGGIMAYRLACELSGRVVAVAFQAGSLEVEPCRPERPVSLLSLHGLADTNIPIDGGRGSGVANYSFNSPRESVETLAELDGCRSRLPLADPTNPDISGFRWTDCDEGTAVEMILVAGANHAWMGHPGNRFTTRLIGEPYPDLDASLVIWSFLSRRSRPRADR